MKQNSRKVEAEIKKIEAETMLIVSESKIFSKRNIFKYLLSFVLTLVFILTLIYYLKEVLWPLSDLKYKRLYTASVQTKDTLNTLKFKNDSLKNIISLKLNANILSSVNYLGVLSDTQPALINETKNSLITDIMEKLSFNNNFYKSRLVPNINFILDKQNNGKVYMISIIDNNERNLVFNNCEYTLPDFNLYIQSLKTFYNEILFPLRTSKIDFRLYVKGYSITSPCYNLKYNRTEFHKLLLHRKKGGNLYDDKYENLNFSTNTGFTNMDIANCRAAYFQAKFKKLYGVSSEIIEGDVSDTEGNLNNSVILLLYIPRTDNSR